MHPDGVKLELTLLHATTMQRLSDADNPRAGEGLFEGRGGKRFQTTVLLTDTSTHTFECKVMLLSTDIGKALVKIKVAPPGLAADDTSHPLCVHTRPFKSRARSDKSDKKRSAPPAAPAAAPPAAPPAAPQFRSLSAGGGDEGTVFRSVGDDDDDDDGGVVFRSAPNEDEDEEEEDEVVVEEEEEEAVP